MRTDLADFGTLLWLRIRQLRRTARQWLMSYDRDLKPVFNKQYALYLIGLGIAWLVMMWAFLVDQAADFGMALGPSAREGLLPALPGVIGAALLILIGLTLRGLPLTLSWQDQTYVAGSPVSRAALVADAFLRRALIIVPLAGLAAALIVMAVNWPVGADFAGLTGLGVLLAAPLVALFGLALAWIGGLLPAIRPYWPRWPRWLALIGRAGAAVLLPGVFLWPGIAVQRIAAGEAPLGLLLGLGALSSAAVAALIWAGHALNLIVVTDASRAAARIGALGFMPNQDVVRAIRRQERMAARGVRFHLPGRFGPAGTLLARGLLAYARAPLGVLPILGWGLMAALLGLVLSLTSGAASIPAWASALAFVLFTPSSRVVDTFRADMENPFPRQFVRANNLALLAADSALPLVLLILGGWVLWIAVAGSALLLPGLVGLALAAALLVLCHAVRAVTSRTWPERLTYPHAVLLAFGLPMVAGLLTESLVVGLVVAGIAAAALGTLVWESV